MQTHTYTQTPHMSTQSHTHTRSDTTFVFVFEQTNCHSYGYLRMFSLLKITVGRKKWQPAKNGERQSPDITAIHPAESCLVLHQHEEERPSKNPSSLSPPCLFPQINLSSSRINLCAHCGEMLYVDHLCMTENGDKPC